MRALPAGLLLVVAAVATLSYLGPVGAEAPRPGNADTGRPPTTPRTQPDREDETVQVAKLIDSVVQPRFLKDAGEFGVRRLATVDGHEPVLFTAETKAEEKVFKKVEALGHDYFITFLHMAHRPGKYGQTLPGGKPPVATGEVKPHLTPIPTAKDAHRNEQERLTKEQWAGLLKVAVDGLPKLREGKDVVGRFEKWGVTMRPVVAKKSCLECHAGAKAGDTLGVMVYAVERIAAKTPRERAAGGD